MTGVTRPAGTVTFLFTDVEGSTLLWEQNPVAMRPALATHDAIVRRVMEGHGGFVFSTAGDAFSVAFGDPSDALQAAAALQEALTREPWPEPVTIAVRVGLHTGTADERDGDFFGPTVNRAARIMGLARGGEVLASAATVELVRHVSGAGIEFVELGTAELRGIGRERVFGLLTPGRRVTFHLPEAGSAGVVRLPSPATSFVGRDVELAQLGSALSSARLVTLVGPGGVGKTRLAVEAGWAAAASFPDGVWLVELATVRERDAVAHAFVAALEVRPIPGRPPAEALVTALAGQHRLVVVDNCEHLLDDVAALLHQLLARCPTVRFLATSQAPVGVAGERVQPLVPLAAAGGGTALFLDRAAAAGRNLGRDDEAAVSALCERLDGLPLAIELAAARSRSSTPTELLGRLGDRFRVLRASRHDGDARHATLQATLEWSYQLLDERTQRVFDRLGVFAAGADLADVVAVVGDEEFDDLDVLDAVTMLVDHSLVVADDDAASTRYRLLETMRAFARDRLALQGRLGDTARRHAEWVAGRVVELNEQLIGPDETAASDAVEGMARLWPELRAALTHASETGEIDLTARLLGTFSVDALFRERDELSPWLDAALELPGILEHEFGSRLVALAAILDWRAGRYDGLARRVELGRALRAAGAPDLPGGLRLAEVVHLAVTEDVDHVLTLQTGGHPPFDEPYADAFSAGLFAASRALWEAYVGFGARARATVEALASFANPILRCYTSWMRTTAALEAGDPAAASRAGRETVELARGARLTWIVDTASNYLAAALAHAGDITAALEAMRAVLEHASAGGGVQSIGNTLRNGIVVLTRLGRAEAAAVLSGWLGAQGAVIPGTASMRVHVAQATEQLAAHLGAAAFEDCRRRGGAMSVPEVVDLLRAVIDEVVTADDSTAHG